ncbi:MAG: DUF3786 domain-containing protein [Treponema sp.]|nr:DUF3786 domain-containing protein [Treponema sp.]
MNKPNERKLSENKLSENKLKLTDRKNGVPFEHYSAIYKSLDPKEISRRCGLSFDAAASSFGLRILGTEYRAPYPDFALLDGAGKNAANAYEKILFLRYLCEGKYFPFQGKRLAYNEVPWGNVYYRNFEGRCLKRCAAAFGRDIPGFARIFEQNPALRAEALDTGDAGYRFEFINGLFVSLILWGADDEFPPSAQILFDDNFLFAFTAEDMAAVGDILAERLKSCNIRNEMKPR